MKNGLQWRHTGQPDGLTLANKHSLALYEYNTTITNEYCGKLLGGYGGRHNGQL